jgi:DHA3 family macrolide efflux protein-like MFS transporter
MYLTVLKKKNILFYLLGGGISNLGNVITGLAFLFLTYDLTQSSVYTTGIVISQVVPYLLFGLIGGVVADWVDKKSLLIWIDLIRAPIILLLVLFYNFDMLTYWHLIIVSFIIQSLGSFFNPTHRAILPLITDQEERTTTNSLLDTVTRGIQVLGPLISVGFLNTVGVIHFFTFDAATYLISAFFIYKINFMEKKEQQLQLSKRKLNDIFPSIKEFAIWGYKESKIRTLFLMTFVMVFFNTWVWQVGLLLQLLETTNNGKEWYSIINGWYGATVIIINLIIPFIWKELNLKTYLLGSLIWGIGVFILGFADHMSFYFIGGLIVAIGLPISGLSRVYLLQNIIPPDKLGRGFSSNAVLLYFGNLISLGLYGSIAPFVETSILFIFSGVMMVSLTIFYYVYFLRKDTGVKPYNCLNNRL